jgi:hypothetical protein
MRARRPQPGVVSLIVCGLHRSRVPLPSDTAEGVSLCWPRPNRLVRVEMPDLLVVLLRADSADSVPAAAGQDPADRTASHRSSPAAERLCRPGIQASIEFQSDAIPESLANRRRCLVPLWRHHVDSLRTKPQPWPALLAFDNAKPNSSVAEVAADNHVHLMPRHDSLLGIPRQSASSADDRRNTPCCHAKIASPRFHCANQAQNRCMHRCRQCSRGFR